jgi:signal transduction histidine kinase
MVAVAFLIPLGLVVQNLHEERAVAEAEKQAAVAIAVLALTDNPAPIDTAIANAGGIPSRIALHGLGNQTTGDTRVPPKNVEFQQTRDRPSLVDVPGGKAYLQRGLKRDGSTAVVEVFIPASEIRKGVGFAWLTLCVLAIALVVVTVWVGDRLAYKVVGSAKALGEAAKSLGDGLLGVRVRPSGPRELIEAGHAFNSMADRVVALLKSERELIADLSHRLRTPLTALRLDAEPIDSPSGDRVRRSINALEIEVDQIIRAARQPPANTGEMVRLSADGTPAGPRSDASEVVRERMVFWSAVAGDQGRTCRRVGASLPAPVPVARDDLAAALDALLGNVFRYTPQGTPIEVAVTRRDGWVAVRVDDGGPGIPDPEAAMRRGVSNKGSTGLGLDIVHRLAAGAGGAVNVGRSQFGGASVVVLLPDHEAASQQSSSRFGLVGRLSREPRKRRKGGHKISSN